MAIHATSGKGQQLPSGCDPGAGSSPPSRARCPPDARSALRTPSQALRHQSDRSRSDPRLALPALPRDSASRASQRPTEDPHSSSPAVACSPATRAGRLGDALAIFPICPSRCSAPGPGNAVQSGSGPGARPTKLRPCPCLRRFRGRGPARRDSYSDLAKPASPHLPAWRAWQAEAPLRPAPGLAPSRPPTRRAPRPGPRRQPASPEGADRAPAAADSSGERGRPVTTGARGPSDAVVSMPFVGGRLNELSARTSRAPPPGSLRVLSCRGLGCCFRHHLRSLQISSWNLGIGGRGRRLCWGLQDGPRVTAAPQGRRMTWAPSSGRKGLRFFASVSMTEGSAPSLRRD